MKKINKLFVKKTNITHIFNDTKKYGFIILSRYLSIIFDFKTEYERFI